MSQVQLGDKIFEIESSASETEVRINSSWHEADLVQLDERSFHLLLDGKGFKIEVVSADPKEPIIKINGRTYNPVVKSETDILLEKLGMNIKAKKEIKELKAPMPGLVLEYRVAVGDEVSEGQPLIVLEAMKMENILKSPSAGVVKNLGPEVGTAIDKNAILITFE
ncbi:MAG: acetyl-CoA carboxylase biotin carboxyl carrier protein subunit [Flavobacteriales bacterium]|nr:acetyl-CoA carboxylase biotin carboxyl carrier protein subunit [Flavobacteriales bacterium]